jgi:hypothetical protein
MDLGAIHEVGSRWREEVFSERLWSYIVAILECILTIIEIVTMSKKSIFAGFDIAPP